MGVMKTFTFPRTDIQASNIVLGLMRISSLDDEQIRTLVATARDSGITMFDHADIYGTERHGCERRFGDAYRLQLQAWIGSLTGREPSGAGAWDGYAAMCVAEAALASLASGSRVEVVSSAGPAPAGAV